MTPAVSSLGESEIKAIEDRLSFMQMSSEGCAAVRSLKALLDRELPIALDKFYEQVRKTPETRAFFESEGHITHAKSAQAGHWRNISNGDFTGDYAANVRTIGTVHARIGLEPRWYVGGYAIVLDHLINAAVEELLSAEGMGADKPLSVADVGRSLGSLVKAAMLDMELAISIYLEEADKAKQRAHAVAAEALRNMSNGLLMIGANKQIRLFNERVREMFSLGPDELAVGMPFYQYLGNIGRRNGWDDARLQRIIEKYERWMERGDTMRLEHHIENDDVLTIDCRPMRDDGAILTYEDVTETRKQQKQIAHMAYHDALTGLPNRRSFMDHL
ncbi:MAG: PAS-domain containing protein, partial [Rhizobium pusense]|nr:PAS-domain containing protein [Agrobacterium pusense]